MCIFNKKSEIDFIDHISLNINKLKFFDMSKITQKNPVLKRNGVKNNYILIFNVLQP
jgi:hypothetical protein